MSSYEQERLYALRQLNLLDTSPSDNFDRITRMASQLFDLPIAAVSLSDEDRQWFKSRVGVDHWEIPRHKACCGEVADTSEILVVRDLQESEYYRDSVLAESGIRFYAGAPLMTRDGYTLGAMCVLGREKRDVTAEEIATLKDLAAMVMAQIELQHAVGRVDHVTGLPNFHQLGDDLDDLRLDNPRSDYIAMSVELIDFNKVSTLQRVMGPYYLEELSRAAARLIQAKLAAGKRLYQIGTCQFVCLQAADLTDAQDFSSELRRELLSLTLGDAAPFMLRPVVGIAPFMADNAAASDVVRMAHSAARDARQAEIGTSFYSRSSDASHQRSFQLLGKFRAALEASDTLHLVYQPKIHVATGQCIGAEALIRWHDHELGAISPAEFIPLVENTPLARALTDWVLLNAIQQAAIWYRQNQGLRISVNVAASNLEEEDFTDRVLSYLRQEALPVGAIELELTESGLIGQGHAVRRQLDALINAGFRIAIDDFGTGYSSLAYLQEIPAHVVKIDRSFIDRVEHEARNQTLVRAMVSMAHDLGYSVVAEGVETEAGYRFLHSLGCDEVQGYLIARPLSPLDFEQWLDGATNP